jgi:hypothetical protein
VLFSKLHVCNGNLEKCRSDRHSCDFSDKSAVLDSSQFRGDTLGKHLHNLALGGADFFSYSHLQTFAADRSSIKRQRGRRVAYIPACNARHTKQLGPRKNRACHIGIGVMKKVNQMFQFPIARGSFRKPPLHLSNPKGYLPKVKTMVAGMLAFTGEEALRSSAA